MVGLPLPSSQVASRPSLTPFRPAMAGCAALASSFGSTLATGRPSSAGNVVAAAIIAGVTSKVPASPALTLTGPETAGSAQSCLSFSTSAVVMSGSVSWVSTAAVSAVTYAPTRAASTASGATVRSVRPGSISATASSLYHIAALRASRRPWSATAAAVVSIAARSTSTTGAVSPPPTRTFQMWSGRQLRPTPVASTEAS